jgi:DNA-binding NarL/FixJ family response regulator
MAPALAQATASVTEVLGPSRFATEFQAGRQLSRDAAASLALRETAPSAAAASDHGSAGVLRQRETDVARLVAGGLTNKEIGGRLFISERTVESHVRNIMNKLCRDGFHVVVTGRDDKRGETVAAELGAAATFVPLDPTSPGTRHD